MNNTGRKFGGRSKGTPNKATNEIRDFFRNLISSNLDTIQQDLDTLEPKDRLKVILEISKFILPTLKATEINDISEKPIFTPIFLNYESEV
jgi:dsRNA-specific ribonuclease